MCLETKPYNTTVYLYLCEYLTCSLPFQASRSHFLINFLFYYSTNTHSDKFHFVIRCSAECSGVLHVNNTINNHLLLNANTSPRF